jgi:hypothetical protein
MGAAKPTGFAELREDALAAELSIVTEPKEFFREKICVAAANQQVSIADSLEFYLVNLLCEFITPDKITAITGENSVLEKPLALLLKQALESPPPVRMRLFKGIGDTSLYISGFFQDYFNRKTYDVDYYIRVGQTAYDGVSSIMRDHHQEAHMAALYKDLAGSFATLVELVAEVADSPEMARPVDILAMYTRWTRSHSERLRKKLLEQGIMPIPTNTHSEN